MISEKNSIAVPKLKPFRTTPLYRDLRDLMNGAADMYGDDNAFIIKTKRATKETPAEYRYRTFIDFRNDAVAFGTGLMKMGLKGKRLAVIGKNCYEWVVTYFAQVSGLGIIVPLDKELPVEELRYSMKKAEISAIVFDKEREAAVREAMDCDELKSIQLISMNDTEGAVPFSEILESGKNATESEKSEYLSLPIDENAVSIILFTSGTSGLAKAVMLSQYNITSNCNVLLDCENILRGDVNIAFLPYHHTFGATGQIVLLSAGTTTVYCDGLKYIQQNLKEYKVSVFVCVPLIIESIYKKIMATVEKQGKMGTFKTGMKISKVLMKLGIDVRRKLFKDVHEQLGGALRYVISGASPLDPVVAEVYPAIGIDVLQGYGMTETSPVLAAEGPGLTEAGTIGRSLPNTDIVLYNPNEEGIGEIVAKGPGVMLGYYEQDDETAKIMEDGWIHTGDLAYLTDKKMLRICGRSKNVIVLKNGKNVYPEEIETLVANLPYVKECMVYGEEKTGRNDADDVVIALRLVYDESSFEGTELPEIEKKVKADIGRINETMPHYKHVANIYLTTEEMEKTTTGKVKRYKQVK